MLRRYHFLAFDPSLPLWPRISQMLIGYFFLSAGYHKVTESLFGASHAPLDGIFRYWLTRGWPFYGYRQFMEVAMPYANVLAAVVVVVQILAGLMLIWRYKTRWAALVLFFIQLNIFLATFGGYGFIVFVGISLWICAFYFLLPYMTERKWRMLTLVLICLGAYLLKGRYNIGDPWPAAFGWQFAHFKQDVMSVSPALKQFVMNISETPFGMPLWTSIWWLQAGILLLLFTRYRLAAGALWLLLLIGRTNIWTTAVTSEGVLWVLTVFIWLTYEEYMQRKHGYQPLISVSWLRRVPVQSSARTNSRTG